MQVADVARALEEIAPLRFAETWDNVGLLLGDPAAAADRVLLTIDLTPEVVAEAQRLGSGLVVAYHPPIFKPQNRVVAGDLAYAIVRAGLSVYSPHTALDAVLGGTNDALGDLVGLEDRTPLRPHATDPAQGMGRIGTVHTTREALIGRVREKLALARLLVAGPATGPAARVAVCAGAAGSLLSDVIRGGADVLVAGELSHHDALRADRAGLTAIVTLHSNAERLALPALQRRLETALPALQVALSSLDRDPFTIVG
jgi:dinuclear metal center YbgI/SA1388 family protein